MVRLTDRPDMTLDVYRGRKTTIQPIQPSVGLGGELPHPLCFNISSKCDLRSIKYFHKHKAHISVVNFGKLKEDWVESRNGPY